MRIYYMKLAIILIQMNNNFNHVILKQNMKVKIELNQKPILNLYRRPEI